MCHPALQLWSPLLVNEALQLSEMNCVHAEELPRLACHLRLGDLEQEGAVDVFVAERQNVLVQPQQTQNLRHLAHTGAREVEVGWDLRGEVGVDVAQLVILLLREAPGLLRSVVEWLLTSGRTCATGVVASDVLQRDSRVSRVSSALLLLGQQLVVALAEVLGRNFRTL